MYIGHPEIEPGQSAGLCRTFRVRLDWEAVVRCFLEEKQHENEHDAKYNGGEPGDKICGYQCRKTANQWTKK